MDRPDRAAAGRSGGAARASATRGTTRCCRWRWSPAYRLGRQGGALATMAAMTAALAWMTLRLARHYCPGAARRGAGGLGAGRLHAAAAALLLSGLGGGAGGARCAAAALDRILEPRARRRTLAGRKEWLGLGLPVLLLPLVKIRFILIAGPLLALGWWHAGRPRRPLLVLAALLAALAGGILLYNQLLYGNPLKIHTWQEVDPQQLRRWALVPQGDARPVLGRGVRPLRLRADLAAAAAGGAPGCSAAAEPAAARTWPLLSCPYLIVVAPRGRVVRRLVAAVPLRPDRPAAPRHRCWCRCSPAGASARGAGARSPGSAR